MINLKFQPMSALLVSTGSTPIAVLLAIAIKIITKGLFYFIDIEKCKNNKNPLKTESDGSTCYGKPKKWAKILPPNAKNATNSRKRYANLRNRLLTEWNRSRTKRSRMKKERLEKCH